MDWRERITLEPGKRGGRPCIRGLRITVYDVLEYLASGMNEEQILADFPELEPDDMTTLNALEKLYTRGEQWSELLEIYRRRVELSPDADERQGLLTRMATIWEEMLGNLEDPSAIGPAMAVALLTTFYGAILANMVFNPLAGKLERNSELESLVNHIYAVGAAGITRQENPRRLEMVINTVLAPAARVRHFD